MKRYYFKLSGTTVVARYIFDTTVAPSGLTEVTEAVFSAAFEVNRVHDYTAGTLTEAGDRDYTFDGVDTPPSGTGRVGFIEP